MPYKDPAKKRAWVRRWKAKNRDKVNAWKRLDKARKRGFAPPRHFEIHGQTKGGRRTPEYRAWMAARERCYNPNKHNWMRYGGRGIKFLFESFEAFLAELGPKPSPEHTLDRFPNPDGNYEPGNVRWATQKEQQNNKNRKKPSTSTGLPRAA